MKKTGSTLVLLLLMALGACETRSTSDAGLDSVDIDQLVREAQEDTTNQEAELAENDRALAAYRKQDSLDTAERKVQKQAVSL